MLFKLIYNLIIIGLFSYIVFWAGHSGWWFLLALVFMDNLE
jgi:hypothetical protein